MTPTPPPGPNPDGTPAPKPGPRPFSPHDMARSRPTPAPPVRRPAQGNGGRARVGGGDGGGGRPRPADNRGGRVSVPSVGPLGALLQATWIDGPGQPPPELTSPQGLRDANALTLLRSTAFARVTDAGVDLPEQGTHALLAWAQKHDLGQVPEHVAAASARRTRALEHLEAQGLHVRRLRLSPQWRLAIGLGDKANAHEIGTTLHGTYGWPIIPGSTIKGAAAHYAWHLPGGGDPNREEEFLDVFGLPLPPGRKPRHPAAEERPRARRGRVRFLDAFADQEPVRVHMDVLTPHAKPYYDTTNTRRDAVPAVPPAEHLQPTVVRFLTITGGAFAVDLVGESAACVDRAATWVSEAAEDEGLGAKTSAGYGYMDTEDEPDGDRP